MHSDDCSSAGDGPATFTLLGQGGKDLLAGGAKHDTCVGGSGKDTEKSC